MHVLIQYSLLLKQCNVSQKDAKSSVDDRQWAALAMQCSQVPQNNIHLDVRLPGASGLGNQTSATVFGHGGASKAKCHSHPGSCLNFSTEIGSHSTYY